MKKIKYILFISLFLVGTLNVLAEEDDTTTKEYVTWVENTKYSIEYTNTYGFKLNGIGDDERLYLTVTNGEKPDVSEGDNGCDFGYDATIDDSNMYNSFIYFGTRDYVPTTSDWEMREGYNTIWILNEEKDKGITYCEVIGPITVEKPSLPSLGSRYSIYIGLENNKIDFFPQYRHKYDDTDLAFTLKIGIINDNDLLKKLAKNTSLSLESLLEYAEKNEGTFIDVTKGTSSSFGAYYNGSITPGAYYYLYITLKNSDGYRNVSDVYVAQGKYSPSNDSGYLTTNFSYEIEGDVDDVGGDALEVPNSKTDEELTKKCIKHRIKS